MENSLFKKTVFISLFSHMAVFSIFAFSLGSRIPKYSYPGIYFWGQVLPGFQVAKPTEPFLAEKIKVRSALLSKDATQSFAPKPEPGFPIINWQKKPGFSLAFNSEKISFREGPLAALLPVKRKEPGILFHPLLPYNFALYFKDRQVVHVELMFKIGSLGLRNPILIKRKISSGNLEVDLLAMRYIGHYLFLRQANFSPDIWQTVKIDLSAKEN